MQEDKERADDSYDAKMRKKNKPGFFQLLFDKKIYVNRKQKKKKKRMLHEKLSTLKLYL